MGSIIGILNTNKSERDKACSARDKLKNILSDIEEFYVSYVVLEDRLRRAIIPQSGLVRRLKGDKDQRPQYEEASQKLHEMKEDFFQITDRRWSEIVEEGPAILTTNAVTGLEIIPELGDITRELLNRKILRYFFLFKF